MRREGSVAPSVAQPHTQAAFARPSMPPCAACLVSWDEEEFDLGSPATAAAYRQSHYGLAEPAAARHARERSRSAWSWDDEEADVCGPSQRQDSYPEAHGYK